MRPFGKTAAAIGASLTSMALMGALATPIRAGETRKHAVVRASWYGMKFHNRRTASGERFDQHGLTAAHRTLPFGTKIRVTNLRNGRTVLVQVNDRGPYFPGRELDLSYGAAQALRCVHAGVVPVRIEVLSL
jgi:rare lipoprotein A